MPCNSAPIPRDDLQPKAHPILGWVLRFKLQFIGEIDLRTFLSVAREKYQKSATQGRPPGASLTEPTTCVRDPFAIGVAKESDRAEDRGHPIARTDGGAPSALSSPEARRGTGKPFL